MGDEFGSNGGKLEFLSGLTLPASRRTFLKWAGMTVAVVGSVGVAGCSDDDVGPFDPDPSATVNLGSGDTGVLNYAYALEQLEAAFYTEVANRLYGTATAEEKAILLDLRDHEVAHREFLKAALGASAIGTLTPNFTAVDFGSRQSVLTTAQTFEDLGVAAYNGAGRYLKNADFLTVAGKIVSVEARHAAAIRDLISPKTSAFAPASFDSALAPAEVLAAASPFIRTTITLRNA